MRHAAKQQRQSDSESESDADGSPSSSKRTLQGQAVATPGFLSGSQSAARVVRRKVGSGSVSVATTQAAEAATEGLVAEAAEAATEGLVAEAATEGLLAETSAAKAAVAATEGLVAETSAAKAAVAATEGLVAEAATEGLVAEAAEAATEGLVAEASAAKAAEAATEGLEAEALAAKAAVAANGATGGTADETSLRQQQPLASPTPPRGTTRRSIRQRNIVASSPAAVTDKPNGTADKDCGESGLGKACFNKYGARPSGI